MTVFSSFTDKPGFCIYSCPISDCNAAKEKYPFLSLVITNCTNPLHKLQTPSKNKIALLSISNKQISRTKVRKAEVTQTIIYTTHQFYPVWLS